jgi:hypothetical protein
MRSDDVRRTRLNPLLEDIDIMRHRSLALTALSTLAPLIVATACSDNDNDTGTLNNATVRFVNATGNSNISVANNGVVGTGNNALGFGGGSSCMTVDATTPNLSFTNSGTNAAIGGFTPAFASGGNYTVVAYTGANGTTQFATLNNAFTPASGQTGLRVFNAASGTGNLVINGNGTALGTGTGVGFGTGGSFFSAPAGSQTITFNTGAGTSTVANGGAMSFTAGQNNTVVVGPAATGSTPLRVFSATGC